MSGILARMVGKARIAVGGVGHQRATGVRIVRTDGSGHEFRVTQIDADAGSALRSSPRYIVQRPSASRSSNGGTSAASASIAARVFDGK
jgi:hypothetical protein